MSPQAGVFCSRFCLLTSLALCFLPSACCGCPALHSAEAKGAHPLAEHQRLGGSVLGLFWDDPAWKLPGTVLQACTALSVVGAPCFASRSAWVIEPPVM